MARRPASRGVTLATVVALFAALAVVPERDATAGTRSNRPNATAAESARLGRVVRPGAHARTKRYRGRKLLGAGAAALVLATGMHVASDPADSAPTPTRVGAEASPSGHLPRAARPLPKAPTAKLLRRVRTEAPIFPGALADPSVLTVPAGPDAGHYLVGTGDRAIYRSRDLVHWKRIGLMFGGRLPKGVGGDVWAPSLSHDGERFFVRYSAREPDVRHADGSITPGRHRVRTAVSRDVRGPYRDLGPTVPLAADARVGDIDPSELIDRDGSRWLMWKNDGNAIYEPTANYIQRLSADGERLVGERHLLAVNDQAWEGDVAEGPSAIRRGDSIIVSLAGNGYAGAAYNVGALRIHAPGGLAAAAAAGKLQIEKHAGPVADSTSARHVGMGHGDFVLGGKFFVSHGWRAGEVMEGGRETIIRRVQWGKDGWPRIVNGRAAAPASERR